MKKVILELPLFREFIRRTSSYNRYEVSDHNLDYLVMDVVNLYLYITFKPENIPHLYDQISIQIVNQEPASKNTDNYMDEERDMIDYIALLDELVYETQVYLSYHIPDIPNILHPYGDNYNVTLVPQMKTSSTVISITG